MKSSIREPLLLLLLLVVIAGNFAVVCSQRSSSFNTYAASGAGGGGLAIAIGSSLPHPLDHDEARYSSSSSSSSSSGKASVTRHPLFLLRGGGGGDGGAPRSGEGQYLPPHNDPRLKAVVASLSTAKARPGTESKPWWEETRRGRGSGPSFPVTQSPQAQPSLLTQPSTADVGEPWWEEGGGKAAKGRRSSSSSSSKSLAARQQATANAWWCGGVSSRGKGGGGGLSSLGSTPTAALLLALAAPALVIVLSNSDTDFAAAGQREKEKERKQKQKQKQRAAAAAVAESQSAALEKAKAKAAQSRAAESQAAAQARTKAKATQSKAVAVAAVQAEKVRAAAAKQSKAPKAKKAPPAPKKQQQTQRPPPASAFSKPVPTPSAVKKMSPKSKARPLSPQGKALKHQSDLRTGATLLAAVGSSWFINHLRMRNTFISSWRVPFIEPWQALVASTFCLQLWAVSRPGRLDGTEAQSRTLSGGPRFFTPAGWAFAIWGPIFLGEIIYTIYQLLPQGPFWLADQSPFFAIAMLLQTLWCFAFRPWAQDSGRLWLSAGLLGGTAVALGGAHNVLRVAARDGDISPLQWLLVHLPISLHFGWISAASLVNLNGYVATTKRASSSPGAGLAVSILSCYLAAALGIAVSLLQGDPVYALVLAWALRAVSDPRGWKNLRGVVPDTSLRAQAVTAKGTSAVLALVGIGMTVSHLATWLSGRY